MPLNLFINLVLDNGEFGWLQYKTQAQYSWVDNPNVLMCSIVPCEVTINIYLSNVEMVIA